MGCAVANAGMEVSSRYRRPRFCDLEAAELWAGLVRPANGEAAARGLLVMLTAYDFLYRGGGDCPRNRDSCRDQSREEGAQSLVRAPNRREVPRFCEARVGIF